MNSIFETIAFLKKTVTKGCYCLINLDGTVDTIHKKSTLDDFYRLIECTGIETLTLEYPNLIMAVDDYALWYKPTNQLATDLIDHYSSGQHINVVKKLGIPGKVIIFNDDDFE